MASTSPFRTSNDLILEALANIGVLAAGQTVSPEDFNYVNEKLDSIFRKLAALEICDVPDESNIPGEWFSDLADIVAGECVTKFGGDMNLINRGIGGWGNVPVGAGTAAQSLKIINRGRPTGEPLQTESY